MRFYIHYRAEAATQFALIGLDMRTWKFVIIMLLCYMSLGSDIGGRSRVQAKISRGIYLKIQGWFLGNVAGMTMATYLVHYSQDMLFGSSVWSDFYLVYREGK